MSHASDVLLRDGVLSDLPALMEVQEAGALQALTHILPQDVYPFPRTAAQSRWAAEIADPDVKVYVIEQGEGRITGFAAVRDKSFFTSARPSRRGASGLAAAAHS